MLPINEAESGEPPNTLSPLVLILKLRAGGATGEAAPGLSNDEDWLKIFDGGNRVAGAVMGKSSSKNPLPRFPVSKKKGVLAVGTPADNADRANVFSGFAASRVFKNNSAAALGRVPIGLDGIDAVVCFEEMYSGFGKGNAWDSTGELRLGDHNENSFVTWSNNLSELLVAGMAILPGVIGAVRTAGG